jgi:hypothetical protein
MGEYNIVLFLMEMEKEKAASERAKAAAAKVPVSTFVASDKMTQTPSLESKGEVKIDVDVYDPWFVDAQIW